MALLLRTLPISLVLLASCKVLDGAWMDTSSSSGFVVAGRRFSFFVAPQSGTVQAMGSNRYGQLGTGRTFDVVIRENVQLPSDTWVVAAAAGAFHSLFLTEDGVVFATGRNSFGQFGDGTGFQYVMTPVQVHVGVKAVAAGYGHSLFLLLDGTVEAAGQNRCGQLGDGTTTPARERVRVLLANPISAIAAGYDFSYFLAEDGDVYAVGQNLGGQLGDGTRATRITPVQVLISGVSFVVAGESHGLFLKDGLVYGTGSNANGQLGDSETGVRSQPGECRFSAGISYASAGVDSSCAIAADTSSLSCTGSNLDGQLGLGDERSVREPRPVDEVHAAGMAMGDSHSLVLRDDYSDVLVSGTNSNGELGDGTGQAKRTFERLFVDITGTSTTITTTSATSTQSTATITNTSTMTVTTVTATRGQSDAPAFALTTMALVLASVLAASGVVFVIIMRVVGRDRPEHQDNHVELPRISGRMQAA